MYQTKIVHLTSRRTFLHNETFLIKSITFDLNFVLYFTDMNQHKIVPTTKNVDSLPDIK